MLGGWLIRAVFWDNDWVLVDTKKLYYQATRELLLTAGVNLTEALFRTGFALESLHAATGPGRELRGSGSSGGK